MQVGQTIGNYNITAKLGEGGMGVVYLAEHPVIGRKVAMKAIHPSLSRNPEVVSRFITEAKSVNQIGNEYALLHGARAVRGQSQRGSPGR